MQIAVIGGGNMGCLYAANLARAGEQVAILDVWEEHVGHICSQGLAMDGLHGSFVAPVFAATRPAALPKADIAFICVNTYSTGDAARAAQVALKDSGFVLTLQNGMGNIETLIGILGDRRVMAGLSYHSADLRGPGRVTHTNEGPTYLGERDKKRSERLVALCEMLERAGMNPTPVDDIISTIWGKFVHNCAINAICGITGLRPADVRHIPALDEFQTRIIEEVLALIRAKGITVPEQDPLAATKAFYATKFHRVSMLQHLERGRPTEIDALNGYVARESARMGLAAPYNEALTSLIKGREYKTTNRAAEARS